MIRKLNCGLSPNSLNSHYTGYVSNNFTINTDAPNGGDDILLGGGGLDWLDGGTSDDMLRAVDDYNPILRRLAV